MRKPKFEPLKGSPSKTAQVVTLRNELTRQRNYTTLLIEILRDLGIDEAKLLQAATHAATAAGIPASETYRPLPTLEDLEEEPKQNHLEDRKAQQRKSKDRSRARARKTESAKRKESADETPLLSDGENGDGGNA